VTVTAILSLIGAQVHEVVAYKTVPAADDISQIRKALSSGEIDVITFTSSSTVANLVMALGDKAAKVSAKVACIGPKTADAATRAGLKVDIVAREHTIPGLVAAIEEYFLKET
jgi:uroporphyrinogen III methyltransferase/synthase